MRSITTWIFDSPEPLRLAKHYADLEGTALLYSAGVSHTSFLCLFPENKIVIEASPRCWEELQLALKLPQSPLPIPYWIGYLGYEMGCFSDSDCPIPSYNTCVPGSLFYIPTVVVHFDHTTRLATLYARSEHDYYRYLNHRPICKRPHVSMWELVERSDTVESYLEKIGRAKEWILDGDIYQVNLSQEINFHGEGSAFELFENVCTLNPAPYSAYINCGSFEIVCSSPERFLYKKGRHLETRPIKGTCPRGRTRDEDRENQITLTHSEKERAELLMITDLMRSDLGRVALPGSVSVKEMWRCEAYTNVFHLVSTIEACVDEAMSSIALLKALFPGGSITGCPKLKAMEAISTLEKRGRGIYTGSIGYITAHGDFDFNIAIRTLIVHPHSIQLQVGGAIVIDSDPIREYEETLHKGESLLKIIGAHDPCRLSFITDL